MTAIICDFVYNDNGIKRNGTLTEYARTKRPSDLQMANLALTIRLGKFYPNRTDERRSLYVGSKHIRVFEPNEY